MSLFTVKYLPKNSDQVFGQQKAVEELKDFIINYKTKKDRCALLHGPFGCGKTSSVYALANELNLDLLEINSSDLRNAENISSFLSAALCQQSLFFTKKVVLIDEVDNLSGTMDRGCIPALLKAVEKSIFPVILTVNDPYEPKIKELKKSSQLIEFHKLQYRTIAHALQWVCEQENIKFEEKAINSLSRQADGDLRGALIDLQSCSSSGKLTAGSLSGISDRKRTDSILHALTIIFKSSSVDNALPALDNLDLEPREIFLWLDTNLPQEYTSPSSLAKAYEHLSRADIFQGRITRRQHWRFLVYINNLLTAGISSAKDNKNITFFGYKPTMRLLRIWQSNIKNAKKKQVAEKLARATHTSVKVAAAQLPYLKQMFKSKSFSSSLVRELNLADDEVEWLRK